MKALIVENQLYPLIKAFERDLMKKKMLQSMGLVIVIAMAVGFGIFIANNYMNEEREDKKGLLETNTKPMIGLSIDSMVIERWHRDVDIIKTRAEELGFEVEVVNSYEDSDKQIKQIRALIKEGAEAILILPHNKDGLADVVEEAKKEDIIVIAYDRLIADANVDAYVSFDNMAVGEMIAGAMIKEVPQGNYVIINGAPADNNSTMIHEGFFNELQPLIDKGEIEVISEVWAENWREEYAYNTISRLMQDEVQVDAIICANDLLAEGAISALSEYGLAGDIPVAGQDANVSACQRIVEGKQLMTVYKPLKNLAEGSVELIYTMLHKQNVSESSIINDGTYDVPYVKFGVIEVNKDNMNETVIKDFFHSMEDVYRE